jgi:hypothetical protein
MLKDGSEIKSKVTEVNIQDIKYKKYENPDGPTYTIPKNKVFLIKYSNGSKDIISENVTQKSKIYFIRDTGFNGSASAFKVFIDDNFVCKLNNKKYSIHEVSSEKHFVSVQFSGTKSKESAVKLEITTEAGKDYYVQIMLKTGLLVNDTYCIEVTESTAKSAMINLSLDNDCE